MATPAITTSATNLVAQLLEVAGALHAAELAIPEETRPDNISLAVDPEGGTISVSATVPATFTSTAGQIKFTATDYLA